MTRSVRWGWTVVTGVLCACLTGPLTSVAEAQETFVGEVITFAGDFCPSGYLKANGTVLPIADNANAALFTVLGTTFGGDGQSTFALPNLVGAAVAGTGEGPGRPNVVLGQTGGTTNTVGVETATAKSVDVPQTQSPSLVVTLCVAQSGAVAQ